MQYVTIFTIFTKLDFMFIYQLFSEFTDTLNQDLVELLSKSGVEVTEHLQVVTDYLSELKLSLVESREDLGLELSLGLAEVVAHVEGLEREVALEEVALGLCQASADFEGS
jgi:hypothetical protein